MAQKLHHVALGRVDLRSVVVHPGAGRNRGFGLFGSNRGHRFKAQLLAGIVQRTGCKRVAAQLGKSARGEPQGNEVVGIGLEQACQLHHLLAPGAALAMLIAAIHGYVHTQALGYLSLLQAAGLAQGSQFLRK